MIPDFKKVRKRDSLKNIFFSIFLGLMFLAIISFLVFSNWKINQKRGELQTKIDDLKKEIENLETKKTELEAGISQTAEDSYWEEKIREQGYKKPGEEQVVVLPPEENKIQKEEEKNFWNPQTWWEWIKEKVRQ